MVEAGSHAFPRTVDENRELNDEALAVDAETVGVLDTYAIRRVAPADDQAEMRVINKELMETVCVMRTPFVPTYHSTPITLRQVFFMSKSIFFY